MRKPSLFSILLSILFFISCTETFVIPEPVYPEGTIIGAEGPEPMRNWEVITIDSRFDMGDYYDTGGEYYICMENDALLLTRYTQVYLNPSEENYGLQGWRLFEEFRVSERFLYIEDPARAYLGWDYVIFIYLDYEP